MSKLKGDRYVYELEDSRLLIRSSQFLADYCFKVLYRQCTLLPDLDGGRGAGSLYYSFLHLVDKRFVYLSFTKWQNSVPCQQARGTRK